MNSEKIVVKSGVTIYASTGMLGEHQPDRMSTRNYYLADKGSRLELLDMQYYFNVATYTPDFAEKYLHSYEYAPEQSWVTYAKDLSGDTYQQTDYIFSDTRYFRICLKRVDGAAFSCEEEERIGEILRFTSTVKENNAISADFLAEIDKTARTIAAKRSNGDLTLAVLTDTHYTVNGTWRDTIKNLQALHQTARFDSIIHLGDMTDGMVPGELTRGYVNTILKDLQGFAIPVHIVLGNHDSNYFAGNPDVFSLEEQVALYQQQSKKDKCQPELPYYYTDYQRQKVRCIFLNSYDNNEKLRYGFDLVQIEWLAGVLCQSPLEYGMIVFSHIAPLARLDYWSSEIRNGDKLLAVLEEHQKQRHNILAYIHGHTHADFVYSERLFPIISLGCAKCEDMVEKKPDGFITEKREIGKVSQELWDVLLVKSQKRQIDGIRFGAGSDKTLRIKG